jgi:hypothetical protein
LCTTLEPDNEIQYLDLDLDGECVSLGSSGAEQSMVSSAGQELDVSTSHYSQPVSANISLNGSINSSCSPSIGSTVYKTVDFVKTKAFNDVRGGIHRKAQT